MFTHFDLLHISQLRNFFLFLLITIQFIIIFVDFNHFHWLKKVNFSSINIFMCKTFTRFSLIETSFWFKKYCDEFSEKKAKYSREKLILILKWSILIFLKNDGTTCKRQNYFIFSYFFLLFLNSIFMYKYDKFVMITELHCNEIVCHW